MRRRTSRTFLRPAFVLATLLPVDRMIPPPAAAESDRAILFADAPMRADLSPRQLRYAETILSLPGVEDVRLVVVRSDFMHDTRLVLPLEAWAPARSVQRQRIELQGDRKVWVGATDAEELVVLVENAGTVTGIFELEHASYRLMPLGGGLHALWRVGEGSGEGAGCEQVAWSPRYGTTASKARAQPEVARPARSASFDPLHEITSEIVVVEVLVAYLEPASQLTPDFKSHVALLITWANEALAHSGIAEASRGPLPVLRLAGVVRLDCEICQTPTLGNAQLLKWFADPDEGAMDAIHLERDRLQADVCVLMTGIDRPGNSGVAVSGRPSPEKAFCLVETPFSLTRAYIMAHEIAHLFDAQHEGGAQGAELYARAFCHNDRNPESRFWTIMCTLSSNRAPYFSNPALTFVTAESDTLNMGDSRRNNARRIGETAVRVASHRGRNVVPVVVHDLAARSGDSEVTLTWRLSSTAVGDLAGVHVLRAPDAAGPYVERTHQALVPAERMRFQERFEPALDAVWYKLALAGIEGSVEFAGPIRVARGPLRTFLEAPVVREDAVRVHFGIGPDATRVDLAVYDVRGRLVRALHEGELRPGTRIMTWNRRHARGAPAAQGIYLLRLRAEPRLVVRKFVLLDAP